MVSPHLKYRLSVCLFWALFPVHIIVRDSLLCLSILSISFFTELVFMYLFLSNFCYFCKSILCQELWESQRQSSVIILK